MTRLSSWLLTGLALIPAGPAELSISRRSGEYLFVLDLPGTPLDEFPDGVKALSGVMTVVDKDGQHMLKASSPSELLLTLPQVPPTVFTVEVDLIPKRCCAPDDIMVEGTPTMNRGPASVQLTWHPARISAVGGGGDMYQSDMPDDLAAAAPGNLTHVVMEFNGPTIKLYTNGRRLYTLEKQFVRGRVLRVWLGGESATNPMYLAGLRVGSGPASRNVIAGNADQQGAAGISGSQPEALKRDATGFLSFTVTGGSEAGATLTWRTLRPIQEQGETWIYRRVAGQEFQPVAYTWGNAFRDQSDFDFKYQNAFAAQAGTRYEYQIREKEKGGSGTVIATSAIQGFEVAAQSEQRQIASDKQASTGSMLPTVVANVTVAQGTTGPVVNWLPVSVPAVYSVKRWKTDDPACCNNASPPTPALNGPPWQDAPLPVAGTYVYEVTATMTGGVASGQAQFTKLKTSGQIAVAAPAPAPPPVVAAPNATVLRSAGSATLLLGPGTLTATPRQGWGIVLDWPEVVNGKYYGVERGPTNQSFSLFTTINPTVTPPKAGSFVLDDVTMLPGSTSFYRIRADFIDGTHAYSPLARFDAPTQVAQVTKLTVSKQGPCDVSSPFGTCTPPAPNSTANKFWLLTWSWVPVPGALTLDYRDEFQSDPSKGFVVSTGGTWHAGSPASHQQTYTAGFVSAVRFCISLIRPFWNADPITNGTCLVADIP